jgi:hypothetical protein
MANLKVSELSTQDIAKTAKDFRWLKKMPKWTVIVGERELPARPLILQAAGVPPNDSTNSHQAVAILQDRGFDIRYEGKPVLNEGFGRTPPPITDEFIRSLRGSCKGESSLVEARERDHRVEKIRATR